MDVFQNDVFCIVNADYMAPSDGFSSFPIVFKLLDRRMDFDFSVFGVADGNNTSKVVFGD